MHFPSWLEAVNWSDVGRGCGERLVLHRMNEAVTLLARQADTINVVPAQHPANQFKVVLM